MYSALSQKEACSWVLSCHYSFEPGFAKDLLEVLAPSGIGSGLEKDFRQEGLIIVTLAVCVDGFCREDRPVITGMKARSFKVGRCEIYAHIKLADILYDQLLATVLAQIDLQATFEDFE